MISLDTETTGVDLRHSAKPYFVSVCDGHQVRHWEWPVDPMTREVLVDGQDLQDLDDLITGADCIVMQNGKFDVGALHTHMPGFVWPWNKTEDTLIAGHLLYSDRPHNLTAMADQYLHEEIEPLEVALKKACQEARRYCRSKLKDWRIAKKGLPEMPSAKSESKKSKKGVESDSPWKFDTWLPKALATYLKYPAGHPWYTVLERYARKDAEVTYYIWVAQERLIKARELGKIYKTRMQLLPIAYQMEDNGIPLSKPALHELSAIYTEESKEFGEVCTAIAQLYDYELELPKSGNNDSLKNFCFGVMKLPTVKTTKKGNPSLDKKAIEIYEDVLRQGSKELAFVKTLKGKRSRDTALTYLKGYQRFWKPDPNTGGDGASVQGIPTDEYIYYRLYPSLNPTGTDTLRWSSSNPNEQNISKKEGFNLRYPFGPDPDHELWSLDAQNIELRLPAYKAKEQEMIDLFEQPTKPPYFGSNHLLVSHILHRKLFEECLNDKGILDGRIFKERYASTWYQWVKNGNFAVQYGAIESSGTADRAYHLQGAQRMIQGRFKNIKKLNDECIAFANKYGYIETMPDKTVDPLRGYPLRCKMLGRHRVLPSVPLNYYIQGTACWWMMKAMIRCQAQLDAWNKQAGSVRYKMIMQVHDELVFEFPRRADPKRHSKDSNLGKIRVIQSLMAQGGDDIGIPTPVSIAYHPEHWSLGISL